MRFVDPEADPIEEARKSERAQIQWVLAALAGAALGAWLMWPSSPQQPREEASPKAAPSRSPVEPLAEIVRKHVDSDRGVVELVVEVGDRHVRRATFRCETRWSGTVEEHHIRALSGAEHPGGAVPPGYRERLEFHFLDRVVPQNTRCFLVEADRAIRF